MKHCLVVIFIWVLSNFQSQLLKAELVANGLTCSMCSNATLNQLKTIPFLDSIETDVEHTKFIFRFKKDHSWDLKIIKSKVEDAGFSVGSLVIWMKFDSLDVDNNFHFTQGENTFHFMDTKIEVLSGYIPVQVLDKGFVGDKEYKKYLKMSEKYPCYKTGSMANVKTLYHIKVLNE
jgi:copper chaperone CopZ